MHIDIGDEHFKTQGALTKRVQDIISKIGLEINEAFVFAKESPFPESIEAYNGEYAI